ARKVRLSDYRDFHLILAMDQGHLSALKAQSPPNAKAKIRMMMSFASGNASASEPQGTDVPDPYYGASDGFGLVLDMIEAAADGLVVETQNLLDER
ncbi:MAG: hypothetical protein AAF556_05110, partial [Pseudomonadota bacterium]